MIKPKINFQEFLDISSKLEIKIGEIIVSERIPNSKKLLKLTVNFNEDNRIRTVVTNIGGKIPPDALEGLKCPFVTNLEPVEMMGVISEAMIIVGTDYKGDIEIDNYSLGTNLI